MWPVARAFVGWESDSVTVRRQGEVTESGRMCFPAKEVTVYAVRGFESHPLRHTTSLSFNI